VTASITADTDLTAGQKQSLIQIYETFRRENVRGARDEPATEGDSAEPTGPAEKESV
jgi:hypothetical protein